MSVHLSAKLNIRLNGPMLFLPDFVFRLNVTVTKFLVMSGRNHLFLGINKCSGELIWLMCFAEGHNTLPSEGSSPGPQDSESYATTLPTLYIFCLSNFLRLSYRFPVPER